MTNTIKASVEWNHTGIHLKQGSKYRMSARGQWVDLVLKYGPEGGPSRFGYLEKYESRRRKPDADWFALCGAIGEDKTTQFVIGAACLYTATRSGELTCFANDVPGWFFRINNHGSVELTVTPEA